MPIPSGFRIRVRPRVVRLALAVVAIAPLGCKSGDDAKAGSDKPEIGRDWSGEALSETQAKVEDVEFRLQLPAGLKLVTGEDAMEGWAEWRAEGDYFSEPSVRVNQDALPPSELDKFVDYQMFDDDDRVEAVEVDGRFVVKARSKDDGTISATTLTTKDGVALRCKAVQAKRGGVPNPEATLAWLASICTSVTF